MPVFGSLADLELLHCGFGIVFAANDLHHPVRFVSSNVVPDDGIRGRRFVARQRAPVNNRDFYQADRTRPSSAVLLIITRLPLTTGRIRYLGSAFGDDQRDVVVLFVRGEDDEVESKDLKIRMAIHPHEALRRPRPGFR